MVHPMGYVGHFVEYHLRITIVFFVNSNVLREVLKNKNRRILAHVYLGVSKKRGTPKWMVFDGKPYSDRGSGGYPYFWKHTFTSEVILFTSLQFCLF